MKLLNSFFKIIESSGNYKSFDVTISLSKEHIIYDGHFPRHPVVPGVVQLQIVHELLENFLDKEIRLKEVTSCKFLKVLNPLYQNQLTIAIHFFDEGMLLYIQASGASSTNVIFKTKAIYYK